jgi:hypothetical protein
MEFFRPRRNAKQKDRRTDQGEQAPVRASSQYNASGNHKKAQHEDRKSHNGTRDYVTANALYWNRGPPELLRSTDSFAQLRRGNHQIRPEPLQHP